MAHVALRRTRNTRGYYLVESYRDHNGRTKKRTLCYLGREEDGTNTLSKAEAHWKRVDEQLATEVRAAKGERKRILRRRHNAVKSRLRLLADQLAKQAEAEARKLRQQEEARQRSEEAMHWQTIELLRKSPSEENARAAKRAFRLLAMRHHPDQGGSHLGFLRLKDAYDRAMAMWKWAS